MRRAAKEGRLAYGYLEDLFPAPRTPSTPRRRRRRDRARAGADPPDLDRRRVPAPPRSTHLNEDDLELLRSLGAVLDAGLPLVAFLQLVRVYGQALAHIADAEAKLFHLYVHEPMIRDGAPVLEIAEELSDLASELLPLSGPIMDAVHQRWLHHFIEHGRRSATSSCVADEAELGRVRVAIAFADLAGYTRLTEEVGEEEALEVVERFVDLVTETLPDDARVIKTIGDEVMVVGTDTSALVDWAVGFQALATERPLPRIGIHAGSVLYRDGDYYGRAVNLAARVGARATGGEVLVTPRGQGGGGPPPVLPADRRGEAEGLRRGDRAVPGEARRDRPPRGPGRGALLRRARLDLPARPRGPARRAGRRRCTSTTACAPDADADEAHCAAAVRAARRAAAGASRRRRRAATSRPGRGRSATPRRTSSRARSPLGHTATDQAETVLYRLAASPGRRALLGMPARSGRVDPAAAGLTREETAAYCEARGLTWREDATNAASARGASARSSPCTRPPRQRRADAGALRDEAEVLDLAATRPSTGPDDASAGARAAGDPGDGRRRPIGAHTDAIVALRARAGPPRSTSPAACARRRSTGG